jgi:hypothetical protein
MNVEILYFAGARDITGRARETLDLPVTVTNIAGIAGLVRQTLS